MKYFNLKSLLLPKLRIIFLPIIVVGCLFAFPTSAVKAQDAGVGLAISPPLDVVSLHNHDPLILAFTVENLSAFDMNITPQIRYFRSDNQTGAAILEDSIPIPFVEIQTPGYSLEKSFKLVTGASQQLVLRISPPENLSHDLTLTFLAEGRPITEGTLLSGAFPLANTTIGANMIIRYPNSQQTKNLITLQKSDAPKILDLFFPLPFRFLLKNNDSTTHQIQGTLTLKRGSVTAQTFTLAPDFILPGSTRLARFTSQINQETTPQETTISGPFIPWKYTAILTLSDETSATVNTYTQTIYILPIIIFVLIIGLLSCYLVIRTLVRVRKTRGSEI